MSSLLSTLTPQEGAFASEFFLNFGSLDVCWLLQAPIFLWWTLQPTVSGKTPEQLLWPTLTPSDEWRPVDAETTLWNAWLSCLFCQNCVPRKTKLLEKETRLFWDRCVHIHCVDVCVYDRWSRDAFLAFDGYGMVYVLSAAAFVANATARVSCSSTVVEGPCGIDVHTFRFCTVV